MTHLLVFMRIDTALAMSSLVSDEADECPKHPDLTVSTHEESQRHRLERRISMDSTNKVSHRRRHLSGASLLATPARHHRYGLG